MAPEFDYERFLRHVGDMGPFQQRNLVYFAATQILSCVQVFMSIFMMAKPEYRCAIPGLANDTFYARSPSHQAMITAAIPQDTSTPQGLSKCLVYSRPVYGNDSQNNLGLRDEYGSNDNNASLATEMCNRWVYNFVDVESSLIAEFDMVCGDEILSTHANMAAMLGMFLGPLISGTMSDIFGRKLMPCASLVPLALLGFGTSYVTTFPVFLALRFFTLMCIFFIGNSSFIWHVELASARYRTLAAMIQMLGWGASIVVLALLSLLIREWRTLQLITSVCPLFAIACFWLIPQSPKWLICKGRFDEAEKVLQQIARANGKEVPQNFLLVPNSDQNELTTNPTEQKGQAFEESGSKKQQNKSFIAAFQSRRLGLRFSVLFFNWIVCAMIYYGLSLNVGVLMEGSLHVNFLCVGVLEMATYIVTVFALRKLGRKTVYCPCLIVGGLACLGTLVPTLTGSGEKWIMNLLCQIGKLGVTASFAIIFIITAEIMPTFVRNSGLGFSSLQGRIGSAVSPYIGNLHYVIAGPLGKALPMVVFGSLAVLAGLLALTLPETRGEPLPDTLQQAKALGRKKEKQKVSDDPNTEMARL